MTKEYVFETPIIFERQAPRKKSSKAAREAREVERHLSRAAHRTVRAMDKGMTTFRKAQKKSAEKQDDGPLLDFVPNLLRGSARAMRQMSIVPLDLMRAAYTPRVRKATRRTIRIMAGDDDLFN